MCAYILVISFTYVLCLLHIYKLYCRIIPIVYSLKLFLAFFIFAVYNISTTTLVIVFVATQSQSDTVELKSDKQNKLLF